MEKKACFARAPELDEHEARQGRAEQGDGGRTDRAGQAGGDVTGRQDVNHARMAGRCVGDGRRAVARVIEETAEDRARDEVGQDREWASSALALASS